MRNILLLSFLLGSSSIIVSSLFYFLHAFTMEVPLFIIGKVCILCFLSDADQSQSS